MTDATPISLGMMTLAAFISRFEQDGPFEILEGEIVPKMPNVFGHGLVANRLAAAMNAVAATKGRGEAFVETTFIRPEDSLEGWVKGSRIPDVMFITSERLDAYQSSTPDWRSKPLMLVPDIVIEVVSPTDSYSDVDAKVTRYLNDGVQFVWVVDPQRNKVAIHEHDSSVQVNLSAGATLTGGDVLPEFEIEVTKLFR